MDSARRRSLRAPRAGEPPQPRTRTAFPLARRTYQRQQTSPRHRQRQGVLSPRGTALLAETAAPKQNKTRRIATLAPNVKGWARILLEPRGLQTASSRKGLTRSQRGQRSLLVPSSPRHLCGRTRSRGNAEEDRWRNGSRPSASDHADRRSFRVRLTSVDSVVRPSLSFCAPRERAAPYGAALPFRAARGLSRGPWRRSPRPCSWALPRTARTACCTRRGPATWSAAWCCSRTSPTAAPWR